MNAKKILLLAVAALCATALVAPASASAEAFWLEKQEVLTENAAVGLEEGYFDFQTMFGGISCNVKGAATLEPGESGSLTEFAFEVASCETTGALKECKVTEAEAVGLPMTIHADTSTSVMFTNVFFVYDLEGALPCPEHVSINSSEKVFGTPLNSLKMEEWFFNGEVSTSLGGAPGKVEGEVQLNPAGVFGIFSEK
jgi:hypothetical protein